MDEGMEERVTEDSAQRITEEGELRMVEQSVNVGVVAQTVADAVALLRQQGQDPRVRMTIDVTTVIAFDGTEVRVTTELKGSPPG